MKKRILSCILALVLLLTLLPAAAAAAEADTTDTEVPQLYSESVNKRGDSWDSVDKTQIGQGLYLPAYGASYRPYQRIWIELNGTRSRVTSVTSQNDCYEITLGENTGDGDYIFQFTAKKTGPDILTFSIAGNANALSYSVEIQLPYSAFYSSGAASADTHLASSQYEPRCTSKDQTFWFLTRENMATLESLKLNSQTLTPAEDGAYYYSLYSTNVLRAEWAEREDGQGSGLKLTLLAAANSLPLRESDCEIRLELSAKAKTSYINTYSATLELQPDHRINYCYVNQEKAENSDYSYRLVADTARLDNDLHFYVMSEKRTTTLAFYYRDPETGKTTLIPYENITIAPSDGIRTSKAYIDAKCEPTEESFVDFCAWKLGTYTISCVVNGTTYSQPLFVTLPPVGLFTKPTYDFDHYVINNNYQRNISTETNALTLWLLAQNGFSSDAALTVQMNGQTLTLGEDGYATLDGKQIARFQLMQLNDDSAQYGLKITFSDGEALNALLKESRQLQFCVRVKSEQFSTTSYFTITNTDTTPSGPTAELGDHTASTDKAADETVTGGGCIYVRIKDTEQVYSISLAHSRSSGALNRIVGSFGYMFDEEAVTKGWANSDTLRLAAFTDTTESNYSEVQGMIPNLVKSASFRVTDKSATSESAGFLSWNDSVAPTENDPYYSLYLCFSPTVSKTSEAFISADITLNDNVVRVQKTADGKWEDITPPPSSDSITVRAHCRIQNTTEIDCTKEWGDYGQLDTMDKLSSFLNSYSFPTGSENRIEIKLAPVAYEGILKFEGNRPTNAEAAVVFLQGTVDESSKTVTTIYGGIEIDGDVMVLSDLYVKPHENSNLNLKDSEGKTVGLHATRSDALSNVEAVTFDGFGIGLDCDGRGYVCASTCVFKNCETGIRINSGEIVGGNNNSEWKGNTFYNCDVGVDLISLPTYISPYTLRFYENNFLNSKTADIRVPETFTDTYYFYRNFFGTLAEGTELTGSALEGATYAFSNIKAGEESTPETVIVNPRRKYPIWYSSTALNVNNYQPADLSTSSTGETGSGGTSTQSLLAAPMRAAAFTAASAANTSLLTIETGGKTTIQNENASSLVIDDPNALNADAEINVVARDKSDKQTVSLGTWTFTQNPGRVNGGFNAGLGNYSAEGDTIRFEVTDSSALSTLNHTLSIPVPTGWSAVTVTGPDGKAQYVPLNTNSVTFPVTKGGQYTITEADPVWAYDPAITGATFTARLDRTNFGSSLSAPNHVILAVYDESGRMLTCYVENITDASTFQTTVTTAVLNKAQTFRLFNLGGSSQPLARPISGNISEITK